MQVIKAQTGIVNSNESETGQFLTTRTTWMWVVKKMIQKELT